MKHINWDLSSKACVRHLEGFGQRPKLNFFSEYGLVTYQIKRNDAGSKVVANSLPIDIP